MNPEKVKTLAKHLDFTKDPNGQLLMDLVVMTMRQDEAFDAAWDTKEQTKLCYAACVLVLLEEDGWELRKVDNGTHGDVQHVQTGDESAGSDSVRPA